MTVTDPKAARRPLFWEHCADPAQHSRAARIPEEIKVWHQDPQAGRGHDRAETEGGARTPRTQRKARMTTRKAPDRGTDNVLADLGFPDAEELAAKAILAKKINDILDSRGLDTISRTPPERVTGQDIGPAKLQASGSLAAAAPAVFDRSRAACGDRRSPVRRKCGGSDRCRGVETAAIQIATCKRIDWNGTWRNCA